MAVFLDTRGHSTLAIGICGRCSGKFPLDELLADPNTPGLLVCPDDRDGFDPWRLSPRATERISLDNARPDVAVAVGAEAVPIPSLPGPVTTLIPSVPWTATTPFGLGAQVTRANPVGPDTVGQTFWLFTCIAAGISGAAAPAWTDAVGTTVADGTVTWMNSGLYLP